MLNDHFGLDSLRCLRDIEYSCYTAYPFSFPGLDDGQLYTDLFSRPGQELGADGAVCCI